MPQEPNIWQIAAKTKYPVDAFVFVQRGLDFTVQRLHATPPPKSPHDTTQHITGQQLCIGLRDYAIAEYGLMARAVLRRFKIYSCEDFGHIVFAMVDAGLMRKTDEDSLHDFVNVFDFADAFETDLSLRG